MARSTLTLKGKGRGPLDLPAATAQRLACSGRGFSIFPGISGDVACVGSRRAAEAKRWAYKYPDGAVKPMLEDEFYDFD